MQTRSLLGVCAAGLSLFLALVGAAMASYPGGTWWDPLSRGHSFWKNFLCDLFHHHALNGRRNDRSAALATAGMLFMLPAIAAFFTLVSRLERDESRAGRLARLAGITACVTGIAVPLTPSDRFRAAHLTAVLITCVPALLAVGGAATVSVRARGRAGFTAAMAVATLVFGGTDAVAYAIATQTRALDWMLPVFQRIAAITLVGWMVAVMGSHLRGRGGER